jgi:hypothetical protein
MKRKIKKSGWKNELEKTNKVLQKLASGMEKCSAESCRSVGGPKLNLLAGAATNKTYLGQ